MSKNANINIRIDPKIKEQAEDLFSNFGITVSEAVNMFLHQSIIYGGIPFTLKLDKPNADTLAAMKESEEIIQTGKKRFESSEDMFKNLGI